MASGRPRGRGDPNNLLGRNLDWPRAVIKNVMTTFGALILSLILVTLVARKRTRNEEARLMRPADEWSPEDMD